MMHALIVGDRGVGKSTLIRRVLKELGRPVSGFETKKEDHLADGQLGNPVYIYDSGQPHCQSTDNLVGYCGAHRPDTVKGAFDRYAPKILKPVPKDHIIIFDELGFMESEEKKFCEAVLSVLDGDIPVIAAVKDRDLPFLDKVRSHPRCRCFYITEKNRDTLYDQVLDFMKMQLDLNYFISLHESKPSGGRDHSALKWDKRADAWNKERRNNRKDDGRVDSTIRFLEERGLLDAHMDIVDIGCGPGRKIDSCYGRILWAVQDILKDIKYS